MVGTRTLRGTYSTARKKKVKQCNEEIREEGGNLK
jgi:hypothetical protein